MIFQGKAEDDQIASQNVGHRLRIFFLQRDPVAQLRRRPSSTADAWAIDRSMSRRGVQRTPFAGPGGGGKGEGKLRV